MEVEKEVKRKRKRLETGGRNCFKNLVNVKKNYYQIDKEKGDLNRQIEEALEETKKHLKEAFIKRERPDYAY